MQPVIIHLNLKATLVLFLVALFIHESCKAQSTIHGSVLFSNHSPAVNASVLLLQAKDSLLIKALVCDKKGTYSFNNVADGNYVIATNHVGYKQAYSTVLTINKANSDIAVADIMMTEEPASLKEVTVTAKKPLLEQKIDRLIINVENSITSAGNTALEVLERSPGLIVDHQNNIISMNGKNGVVLMMNGRLSHISVSALMQLLAAMPSGNIEKIELITTPPASLDAEGNAGYINIVLKENNNIGTNGSTSVTLGYGKGWITAANMSMNHRKGKVNIYGDVAYSRLKTPHTIYGYNTTSNNGNINETIFEGNRVDTVPNINGRLGIDVELTKHTVAGLLLSGYNNNYSQSEHNTSTIVLNGTADTLIKHNNSEINHWYNYASNINLQHTFNKDDKLLFNLDYIFYYNNQPVNYYSEYYNKENKFIYGQFFRSGKQTPSRFWVAAFDYSKKLTSRISMEAGIKQTITSFNNALSFERLLQDKWVKENSLSATYKLKEDYTAAYTTFNITINKSTEAKAGLRFEHTNSNLGTGDIKNIVNRHYGNFFPSVFLTHKLNENSSMDLSYSRRITRPTFNDLAPFTYYANANTLITGNPTLQPSVSDNFKAGYTFKKYLLSLSYSFDDNAISGFQPQSDSVSNKVIVMPQNFINQKTASLVLSLPFSVTKWYEMQYNITARWQGINALYKSARVSITQTNFIINGNQRFTLPKDFSLEISGYYQSPMLFGLGRSKPTGSLDAGIKKKLAGNGGNLVFNATNVLNTTFFSAYVNLPEQNLIGGIKIYYARPAFRVTYQRSFGKEKLRATRKYSTGAEDEKGRVH